MAFTNLKSPMRDSVSRLADAGHEPDRLVDRDTLALARTGKKQILKRRFGLLSMVGLACSMMISWQGVSINLGIGLLNGGPAGLLYGIIVSWIGLSSVFVCMGELASMAPTAGGQYHWTALLAPTSSKVPLSYITGWITVLTWIAITTAASYVTSSTLQQLIHFSRPEYDPQRWQGALLMWAVLFAAFLVNTVLGFILPLLELSFLVFHVVGFFAFLIPIVSLGKSGNAHEIFTRFNDGGDWGNFGVAFLVGLQGDLASFTGTDAAVHMSEEVYDTERNVPRSMILALLINGVLAFGIMLAFMFYAGPIDDLLMSESEYPFIDIIFNATQSRAATIALVSYIVFMGFAETVSALSSGSRMVWSFARDHGLPFWPYIRKIGKRTALPTTAILIVVICAGLLGLIQIGSTVALNDVISLVVEGFCSSYLCVLLPLLYHRIKGNIREPRDESDPSDDSVGELRWGPWRQNNLAGTLNNIFACCFLVLVIFWSFWPPTRDPTAESMNFSSAVLGGVAIASGIYYMIWGRKFYNGPIIELQDAGEVEYKEPRTA